MMKKTFSFFVLLGAGILGACGGSDGHSSSNSSPLNYQYQGTLSGQNCFSFTPMSETIKYVLTIAAPREGADVTLVDNSNITWHGTMTSATSFKVLNTAMGADTRTNIVGSNLSPNGADIAATTSCVSFRCCTTLTGQVGT